MTPEAIKLMKGKIAQAEALMAQISAIEALKKKWDKLVNEGDAYEKFVDGLHTEHDVDTPFVALDVPTRELMLSGLHTSCFYSDLSNCLSQIAGSLKQRLDNL